MSSKQECHGSCEHCDPEVDPDGSPRVFQCGKCPATFCCLGCECDHTMLVHDGYIDRKKLLVGS